MSQSAHSTQRMQQRCIPPVVDQWLDRYGEEEYDGHGGVRIYFSRASIRQMERELGRHFVRQNSKYLRAYCVDSSRNPITITTGWITSRSKRAALRPPL